MIVDYDYGGYDMERIGRKIIPDSARPFYKKWKWPPHLCCPRHFNLPHNEGEECHWCKMERHIDPPFQPRRIIWKTADGTH